MRQMKDIKDECFEKIPAEWKISRLKALFSFGKGLPITKDDLTERGVSVISYGQIHSKSNTGVCIQNELIRFVPESFLQTNLDSLVKQGDFIFADTSEDIEGCGNCVYVDRDMPLFAGYHTIILKSKADHENKYLAYLFKTDAWRSQIRSVVYGIKVFSITKKILNNTIVILPNVIEQRKIVDYLDMECSRIDSVIEQTRVSIEEYKKLKQSVITEAVTKGIRTDRPMKDSGVEWIGEICADYDIYRLKFLLDSPLIYGANEAGVPFDTLLPRYIRITDITMDGKLKDDGKLSLPLDVAKDYMLEDDDILFARSGASVGKAFIYKKEYGPSAFAGYLIKANVGSRILADYLFLYTQSSLYEEWKNQIFIQATIQNIGADRYSNLPVILPSVEEQHEIVCYLNAKCTEIDNLVASKEQLVSELETYKKSLIYEYVTGKKEVQ